MRILEEFWYGNIEPTEYDTSSNKAYKKLVELIFRNEEKLRATMTDDKFKAVLCLLIQISQICPELTAEDKVVKADWMMFLQILTVHPSPLANGSVFLRQSNVGDVIVTHKGIIEFTR